jgi:hypothetical protein
VRLPNLLLAVTSALMACRANQETGRADETDAASAAVPLTRNVSAQRVNAGTRGMIGQVRWAYSPDSSAFIAEEDWASVEAEPFFDGFRVASERYGSVVGRDSVWDAAPSPDWTRVAYGAALIVHAGESETLPAARMADAARTLGVSAEEARASQFVASGMVAAAGFAKLGIMDLATGSAQPLPSLTGWQVRWSRDGSRVIGGMGPALASDNAPSRAWVAMTVTADSSVQHANETPMDTASIGWISGPTLDVSVTPDTAPVTLPRLGHTVSSARDTIRVDRRVIGAGTALAATRHGCYVLALVRDASAGEFDPKWRAVIYDAGCDWKAGTAR